MVETNHRYLMDGLDYFYLWAVHCLQEREDYLITGVIVEVSGEEMSSNQICIVVVNAVVIINDMD